MELRVRFALSAIDKGLLASGNVGDYFQKFCSEFFAKHYRGAGHSSRPGVDGAIDGWFQDENGIAYWDSKYVGDDDDETIERRWKDVASVFDKNLRSEAPALSQYAPWYSPTQPVRFYHFCVSARFANKARRDELQRTIDTFFRDLGQRSGLEHLASLKVRVWDWDDFDSALSAFPGLLLRWFLDQRPTGWTPLESIQYKGSGFESYLREQVLPYFSLAAYKQLEPKPDILDEDGWLNEFEKDEANGFVITGAGGIGKTRLMYELGWLAHKRGWIVIVATGALLKPGALRDVVLRADDEAKRLLLIDYAETRSDFAELWDVVSELNIAGRMVRVLATSRHTSVRRLSELVSVRWIEMSPVNAKDWFARYRRAVTEHILQQTGIQPSEHIIAEFSESPVLAVFAFYLFQSGRDANLEALLGETRFEEYLKKCLRISFPGKHNALDDVARLLAQMPFEQEVVDTLDAGQLEVWKALMSDHWVDFRENSDRWYAIHDLFSDTLLQCYFREVFQQRQYDLTRELVALFDLARRLETTTSCLTAIERVRHIRGLDNFDWPFFFSEQIRQHAREWSRSRIALLQSPLITAEEKLDQIRESLVFWESVEFEPQYEQAVMSIAAECNVRHKHMQQATTDMLVALYRRGISTRSTDNKLATHAMRILPPGSAVDPLVLDLVQREARALQNDFPLVAWLNSGRSSEDVRTQVIQWLNNFSHIYTAGHLIASWLEASNNPIAEKPVVMNWMRHHSKRAGAVFIFTAWISSCDDTTTFARESCDWMIANPNKLSAGYLYVAWLNARSDVALLRDAIDAWLRKHSDQYAASYVMVTWLYITRDWLLLTDVLPRWLESFATYSQTWRVLSGWLNAGGNTEQVQEPIRLWMTEHKDKEAAGSVYSAWLKAGGEKTLVQESIRTWLAEHQDKEATQSVYGAWLNAGGEKTLVQQPMQSWLAVHQHKEDARFVYVAWLKAGGEKILVQEPMLGWLAVHQDKGAARIVYSAWLNMGGEKTLVQEPMLGWLAVHQDKRDAIIVYCAWLNAGGDKTRVQEPIWTWLTKRRDKQDAGYIYDAWLRAGGEKTLMQEPIRAWLAKHQDREIAQSVYSAWLNAGGEKTLVQEPIRTWLAKYQDKEAARFVYVAWLDAGGEKTLVQDSIRLWLGHHQEKKSASHVYLSWLRAGGDTNLVHDPIQLWLPLHQKSRIRTAVYSASIARIFSNIRERSRMDSLSEDDYLWIAQQCTRPDVQANPEVLFAFPPFTLDTFRTSGGQRLMDVLIDTISLHVKSPDLDNHSARHLTRLLAFLVDSDELVIGGLQSERIKKALVRWVRNALSFSEMKPSEKAPVPRLVQEIAFLISTGELDALLDSDHLERIFAWTLRCSERQIGMIREQVGQYLTKYPEKSTVWNSWHGALIRR